MGDIVVMSVSVDLFVMAVVALGAANIFKPELSVWRNRRRYHRALARTLVVDQVREWAQ